MLLRLMKVNGHSMEPTLKEGSFFIASNFPFYINEPTAGDIIVFRFNKEYIVKRIVDVKDDKYYLDGDNKKDTLPMMPIKRKQILAKLVVKF